MADISVLNVKLYGETIGTLTHVGGDRTLFSFTDGYIADTNRPTLGLGFKDEYGQLITEFAVTQKRLLPFFSNLLPEGHLREYLAGLAEVNPEREFYLLWALGHDLSGAITVEPADGEAWPPGLQDQPAEEAEKKRENALRFSLAGVQLKFSAVHNEHANKGLTIPASGVGGSWIVKLPSLRYEGVPENEYALLTLARLIGIDVPDIQLIDVDAIANLPDGIGDLKGQAFAIKRFDRTPDGPVHIEDFAQVFGVYPEKKYGSASYRKSNRQAEDDLDQPPETAGRLTEGERQAGDDDYDDGDDAGHRSLDGFQDRGQRRFSGHARARGMDRNGKQHTESDELGCSRYQGSKRLEAVPGYFWHTSLLV